MSELDVRIEGMGKRGEGVAHSGERTVFVPYTLPDEVFAAPFIKLALNNTAANGLTATVMAKG